jgi:flavodoxin
MAIGIVYFSKSNNTATGAEILAQRIGGTLIRLDEIGRSGPMKAIMKKGSKLGGDPWGEASSFDELYLMSPIWAGNGSPPMNAFLDGADLSGKRITLITFQADPQAKSSAKVHQYWTGRVVEKGGTVVARYGLVGGPGMYKFAGREAIEKQIDTVTNGK